jgi:hypothetical protein
MPKIEEDDDVDVLTQLGCKHAKGYGLAAQPRVAGISLIMRSGGKCW